jgi:hypothetical protein
MAGLQRGEFEACVLAQRAPEIAEFCLEHGSACRLLSN